MFWGLPKWLWMFGAVVTGLVLAAFIIKLREVQEGRVTYVPPASSSSGPKKIESSIPTSKIEDLPTSVTRPSASKALAYGLKLSVSVAPTKADGRPWDVQQGSPDIAVCVDSPRFGVQCYPDGVNVASVHEPRCRDSFRCQFEVLADPDEILTIAVIDVDIALNDLIGAGQCSRGRVCYFGQTTVTLE